MPGLFSQNVHHLNLSRLAWIGRISVNVLVLDYEIRYLVGILLKLFSLTNQSEPFVLDRTHIALGKDSN